MANFYFARPSLVVSILILGKLYKLPHYSQLLSSLALSIFSAPYSFAYDLPLIIPALIYLSNTHKTYFTVIWSSAAIWALILAVAGHRMIFWTASGVATGISLIPLFYHGTDIYLQWLDASLKHAPNLLIFPANNSLQGLTARFNLPQIGSIAGIALAMFVLVFVAQQKLPVSKNNSFGIIETVMHFIGHEQSF